MKYFFKNLINWSYERNWKEALGFYFFALLTIMIVGAGMGALVVFLSNVEKTEDALTMGVRTGAGLSLLFCTIISALIVRDKNLYGAVGYGCILLSALLSVTGGVFGLLPVTFLTMRARVEVKKETT